MLSKRKPDVNEYAKGTYPTWVSDGQTWEGVKRLYRQA